MQSPLLRCGRRDSKSPNQLLNPLQPFRLFVLIPNSTFNAMPGYASHRALTGCRPQRLLVQLVVSSSSSSSQLSIYSCTLWPPHHLPDIFPVLCDTPSKASTCRLRSPSRSVCASYWQDFRLKPSWTPDKCNLPKSPRQPSFSHISFSLTGFSFGFRSGACPVQSVCFRTVSFTKPRLFPAPCPV